MRGDAAFARSVPVGDDEAHVIHGLHPGVDAAEDPVFDREVDFEVADFEEVQGRLMSRFRNFEGAANFADQQVRNFRMTRHRLTSPGLGVPVNCVRTALAFEWPTVLFQVAD